MQDENNLVVTGRLVDRDPRAFPATAEMQAMAATAVGYKAWAEAEKISWLELQCYGPGGDEALQALRGKAVVLSGRLGYRRWRQEDAPENAKALFVPCLMLDPAGIAAAPEGAEEGAEIRLVGTISETSKRGFLPAEGTDKKAFAYCSLVTQEALDGENGETRTQYHSVKAYGGAASDLKDAASGARIELAGELRLEPHGLNESVMDGKVVLAGKNCIKAAQAAAE